uniref:Ig-like domain-containing protein n=1 Tax=Leptobrachium leishanense TaxID=445787 RepID=A0A8C5M6T2_9ANUR
MFVLYLFIYLLSLTKVKCDIELVQPSSEIRKPGDSVTLTCNTSGYTFTSYWIHWIQQIPGRGLVWIGAIDPSDAETSYASSFQNRCKITTDNSKSTGYLQLNSLRTEDTAVYYCARRTLAIVGRLLIQKHLAIMMSACSHRQRAANVCSELMV